MQINIIGRKKVMHGGIEPKNFQSHSAVPPEIFPLLQDLTSIYSLPILSLTRFYKLYVYLIILSGLYSIFDFSRRWTG